MPGAGGHERHSPAIPPMFKGYLLRHGDRLHHALKSRKAGAGISASLDGYGHKTEHKNGKGNAGDNLAVAAQGSVLVEHHGLAPAAQPA